MNGVLEKGLISELNKLDAELDLENLGEYVIDTPVVVAGCKPQRCGNTCGGSQ
jgi:hypothetical protein